MAIAHILAQIDAEIALLKQARNLLAGTGKTTSTVGGRAAKTVTGKARKKRVLSAEARKRIADAQRRRWAAQKAKAKK
ncbi:MAG TPA: hypothetical protein VFU55_13830 [Terracidiphilus sp.]|nr:hypothetical protein [Terracidiphilus sp.]